MAELQNPQVWPRRLWVKVAGLHLAGYIGVTEQEITNGEILNSLREELEFSQRCLQTRLHTGQDASMERREVERLKARVEHVANMQSDWRSASRSYGNSLGAMWSEAIGELLQLHPSTVREWGRISPKGKKTGRCPSAGKLFAIYAGVLGVVKPEDGIMATEKAKAILKRRGWSQRQLAAILKVTEASLGEQIRGRTDFENPAWRERSVMLPPWLALCIHALDRGEMFPPVFHEWASEK